MSFTEDTEDTYLGNPVELGQERLFPMFMFRNVNEFLPQSQVSKLFQITFEVTLKNSTTVPTTYFDVVPCSQISRDRVEFSRSNVENFKYFDSLFETYMYCIDPKGKKAILSGSPDGMLNTVYSNLVIKPCLSTTEGCRNDLDFTGISVSFIKVNRALNLQNFTNPVKYFWNFEDDFYITKTQEQRLRIFLMQTEVYDQKGFPYDKVLAKKFAHFEKQNRLLLDRPNSTMCEPGKACPWYLSFVMTSGGRTVKITRTYKTFAEVLGEIGGFRTIVMIIVMLLFKYSYSGSEEATLVEHVYGLKPKTSHHFSCCKRKDKDEPDRDPEQLSVAAINLAYASIMKTLDVRTIVREISMVKVISLALLKEQHHSVVPWAMVNADMKLIAAKRRVSKKSKNKTSSITYSQDLDLDTSLVQINSLIVVKSCSK